METFGLYWPDLPYRRRWWRVNPAVLVMLLRQAASYTRWVVELEDLRRYGPGPSWDRTFPRRPGTRTSERSDE